MIYLWGMLTITLTLDPLTADWLTREAALTGHSLEQFAAELLRELADPDHVEGELIDRLLADATRSFPPVMTLDEQSEMKEELLDDLCRRVVETYHSVIGVPMTLSDQVAFRDRLEKQAGEQWP